jgi:hypothetical protein
MKIYIILSLTAIITLILLKPSYGYNTLAHKKPYKVKNNYTVPTINTKKSNITFLSTSKVSSNYLHNTMLSETLTAIRKVYIIDIHKSNKIGIEFIIVRPTNPLLKLSYQF